jgi:hypothetical protein
MEKGMDDNQHFHLMSILQLENKRLATELNYLSHQPRLAEEAIRIFCDRETYPSAFRWLESKRYNTSI